MKQKWHHGLWTNDGQSTIKWHKLFIRYINSILGMKEYLVTYGGGGRISATMDELYRNNFCLAHLTYFLKLKLRDCLILSYITPIPKKKIWKKYSSSRGIIDRALEVMSQIPERFPKKKKLFFHFLPRKFRFNRYGNYEDGIWAIFESYDVHIWCRPRWNWWRKKKKKFLRNHLLPQAMGWTTYLPSFKFK